MITAETYYEVKCDHEGCGVDLSDVTGDWTALKTRDQAEEAWESDGGVILRTDMGTVKGVFCDNHAPVEEEEE